MASAKTRPTEKAGHSTSRSTCTSYDRWRLAAGQQTSSAPARFERAAGPVQELHLLSDLHSLWLYFMAFVVPLMPMLTLHASSRFYET